MLIAEAVAQAAEAEAAAFAEEAACVAALAASKEVGWGGWSSDSFRFCSGPGCTNKRRPDGAPLDVCNGCKRVCYCGKACQAADWKAGGHKAVCKAAARR